MATAPPRPSASAPRDVHERGIWRAAFLVHALGLLALIGSVVASRFTVSGTSLWRAALGAVAVSPRGVLGIALVGLAAVLIVAAVGEWALLISAAPLVLLLDRSARPLVLALEASLDA